MEEDIKILEEQLNTYKRHIENYQKEECLTRVYYELKSYATALENLIKGYRELKERNIYLVNERKKLEELLFMSNENYIPKSKIKEKIEEYNSIGMMGVVRALQELLGDEK